MNLIPTRPVLGCALYIFGDVVNDHGLFSVKLDNRTEEQFNGVAGCGGAFAKACEKTNTLAYFASNLNGDMHTVTLRNIAGPNSSFFGVYNTTASCCLTVNSLLLLDLDSIVYTTPSKYAPRVSSSSGSSAPSGTSTNNASLAYSSNLLLLLLFGVLYKAFR
jgi:hypothetical protein